MLACENLSVQRADRIIFRHLGFSLMPGSILLLKGHNGSGKTTLIKTLAGLITPHTGQVEREGILHYIGHKTGIKPRLTVRENLVFFAELYKTPMLLMAGISYFHLDPILDKPCYTLSAGWQKRVALARLVICYSDLWLLDEPEVHLDSEGKEMLWNLVHTRISQGGIAIIASHADLPVPSSCILQMEDFR